jgi:hypothetical protein
MEGVEPFDSGVAHRCVTATLHLLGGLLRRDLVFWITVDAGARSVTPAWVGWESNPRCDGLRVRCKACVCYRPNSSHPLELNQNLSGFSRARRPLRQGGNARRVSVKQVPHDARGAVSSGACQGTLVITLRLSESTGMRRTHLGP